MLRVFLLYFCRWFLTISYITPTLDVPAVSDVEKEPIQDISINKEESVIEYQDMPPAVDTEEPLIQYQDILWHPMPQSTKVWKKNQLSMFLQLRKKLLLMPIKSLTEYQVISSCDFQILNLTKSSLTFFLPSLW